MHILAEDALFVHFNSAQSVHPIQTLCTVQPHFLPTCTIHLSMSGKLLEQPVLTAIVGARCSNRSVFRYNSWLEQCKMVENLWNHALNFLDHYR